MKLLTSILLLSLVTIACTTDYAPVKPVACTLIGCPPPQPDCKKVKEVYPNGLQCPPCDVCADDEDDDGGEVDPPVACTKIGCAPIPADCRRTKEVFPNGPNCPSCMTCVSRPRPVRPRPPMACTEIGCGTSPPPGCKKIRVTYPNGRGCPPRCHTCMDPPVPPHRCPLPFCREPQVPCVNGMYTPKNEYGCEQCPVCCPVINCFTCDKEPHYDDNGCLICPVCPKNYGLY